MINIALYIKNGDKPNSDNKYQLKTVTELLVKIKMASVIPSLLNIAVFKRGDSTVIKPTIKKINEANICIVSTMLLTFELIIIHLLN